jgi:outer membrane protein OmpA-like peptidoglycan-associated protein
VTTRTCLASGKNLVFIAKGRCRANIIEAATGVVARRLTTTVTDALINSVKVGNPVAVLEPIYFYKESVVLDGAAQSRIRSIRSTVTAAGSVLIIGHSGTLNGNTVINVEISKGRAASTLRALASVGAKGPFFTSGVGALQPANKEKTEAAQAKNRRVVIALIP